MNDLSLAEVSQPRDSLEIELMPIADLVLNILEDIIRYLILGYSNEIILALQVPSLTDPNRIAFLTSHIC